MYGAAKRFAIFFERGRMNIHAAQRTNCCRCFPVCTMSSATLLDVARKARVSAGTVSRVLHGHPAVSEENTERVRRAIDALEYVPRQRKAAMRDLNPLESK